MLFRSKLNERKEADMEKFEQEKDKLKTDLLRRKQNLILKQIADNLAQKAKTKIQTHLI